MIVSKGTRIYIVYTKVFPWSNAYVDCSITRQAVSSVWSNTNSRLNSHHHLLLAASEQRYAFILHRFLTKLYDLGPIDYTDLHLPQQLSEGVARCVSREVYLYIDVPAVSV